MNGYNLGMNSQNVLFRPMRNNERDALFNLHNDIVGTDFYRQFQQSLDRTEGVWVLTLDDVLVGYTAVFSVPGIDGLLEMQGGITPDCRRCGLGSIMLQGVLAALRDAPFHTLSYPVENMNMAVAKFLQHHNFWVEHEEWTMTMTDLTYLPPIPANHCHLQTLPRSESIARFLAVYDASFADMAWNQPFSQAEMAHTLLDSDEMLFLVNGDAFLGCAWLRYPEPNHAEIEPIGIVKAEQGKRYGRILLTTILQKLAQQNIQTVSLGVWANNHKAINLYQSVGFTHTDTVTYLAHSL